MSLLWVQAAYYHGTDEHFAPGDLIHPQSEHGGKNWAERLHERTGEDHYREMAESKEMGPYSSGHVYHTDAPWEARDYGKNVYEVEPLSPVEKDPENPSYWTRNQGPVRVIREM